MAVQKILKKIYLFVKKLKTLDYLIIVAVILAGIILFKFFNPEEQWTTATVSANGVPFFQVNSLHVGDSEKNPSGKKIAEIINIQAYNAPLTPIANKDIFVKIKLLAEINPRSKELQYKNKVIKIGSPVELMFTSGLLSGKIADLGTDSQQGKSTYKTISLRLYDQWPWLADAIKIGTGEIGEDREKISEVIEKEIKPAEITTTAADGQTLLQTNPRKVDIILKIKVKVLKINDELIFHKDKEIIVGDTISLDAGNIRIENALIESIE